jgi:hypothetical protein
MRFLQIIFKWIWAVVPFHAQPIPASHRTPFTPKLDTSDKLTTPAPFKQLSDVRASQRAAFDESIAAREQEQREAQKRLAEEKRKAEEEEIKALRKAMEFKARPMLKVAPMSVKRSDKPLTEPKTPPLKSGQRAIARDVSHQENALVSANYA